MVKNQYKLLGIVYVPWMRMELLVIKLFKVETSSVLQWKKILNIL